MSMDAKDVQVKEQSIFSHVGNKIITDDREINIIARLEKPLIVILGNVLSEEECDELIKLSMGQLSRSKIATGVKNEHRSSSSTFIEEEESEIISRVERRLAYIMNIPKEHGEGIQILNYKIGQEYKAHFDFYTTSHKQVVNPRISTIVIYLNDVEQGGETYFPHQNFYVAPHKGMAVYFEYFYHDQALNELTLHGGAPVIRGEKWAATQWMRRKQIG